MQDALIASRIVRRHAIGEHNDLWPSAGRTRIVHYSIFGDRWRGVNFTMRRVHHRSLAMRPPFGGELVLQYRQR